MSPVQLPKRCVRCSQRLPSVPRWPVAPVALWSLTSSRAPRHIPLGGVRGGGGLGRAQEPDGVVERRRALDGHERGLAGAAQLFADEILSHLLKVCGVLGGVLAREIDLFDEALLDGRVVGRLRLNARGEEALRARRAGGGEAERGGEKGEQGEGQRGVLHWGTFLSGLKLRERRYTRG